MGYIEMLEIAVRLKCTNDSIGYRQHKWIAIAWVYTKTARHVSTLLCNNCLMTMSIPSFEVKIPETHDTPL